LLVVLDMDLGLQPPAPWPLPADRAMEAASQRRHDAALGGAMASLRDEMFAARPGLLDDHPIDDLGASILAMGSAQVLAGCFLACAARHALPHTARTGASHAIRTDSDPWSR
jgi:hypothetical protein